ncbi:MAG: MBL fold metallo-hydrolase [Chloroflexi bacterium]|nr:MBL fold metallo-hydrolase [Chloroflexota bacterium]
MRLLQTRALTDLGHAFNRPNSQVVAVAASVVLLVAGFAMWAAWLTRDVDEPRLTVTFLQTSYGESIFIRTPNDNRLLIDGGGDENEVAHSLGSLLGPWDRNIDIVMLTHPDTDHVGGLTAVLGDFHVDTVIHSGIQASSDVFDKWSTAIEDHNDVVVVRPGMTLGLDHDVFLDVISGGCLEASVVCANANDASIVARLRHGEISFLLTGDIERAAELRLANSIANLRSTVFKAPHHGSATSSTSSFIEVVDPAAVVVAVGTQNRYRHPDEDVMARLKRAVGADRVFRTDLLGAVVFETNGKRLWTVYQN